MLLSDTLEQHRIELANYLKEAQVFTVSSHMVSRLVFLLLVTDHFPPLAHSGSSHFGSIPVLKQWKSAWPGNLLGRNTWSCKLHPHFKNQTK